MSAPTTDELLQQVRDLGGRVTVQRRIIVDTLLAEHDHITADQLIEKIHQRYPEINAATVYRTLETLDQTGALNRLAVGGGATRWELASNEHQHLICDTCGTVQEVVGGPFARLAGALAEEYGFQADIGHLAVTGRCADCAAMPTSSVTATTSATTGGAYDRDATDRVGPER